MTTTRTRTWVTWTGAKVAHAIDGIADAGDIRNGSFPLLCGRWAPDPMDRPTELREATSGARCARCQLRAR